MMMLHSQRELEASRETLRFLEEHYAARKLEPTDNPRLRELSLRAVKRYINQLKEELARYEAHSRAGA
jgi:hypothetical protein